MTGLTLTLKEAYSDSFSSIQVRWELVDSAGNYGDDVKFVVKWDPQQESPQVQSTSYSIKNLQPSTSYDVSVHMNLYGTTSNAVHATVQTQAKRSAKRTYHILVEK